MFSFVSSLNAIVCYCNSFHVSLCVASNSFALEYCWVAKTSDLYLVCCTCMGASASKGDSFNPTISVVSLSHDISNRFLHAGKYVLL